MKRITVDHDLDKSTYLDVLISYFNMKYFFKNVYIVTTEHGIHLRAYTDNDKVNEFVLRGMFRDDEIRLELDLKRKFIHNVDFFSKKGRRAYLSTEEEVLSWLERSMLAKVKGR